MEDAGPDELIDDVTAKVHPRAARIKYARAKDYLAHLEFARRAKIRMDGDESCLKDELVRARDDVRRYAKWADARIEPRKRFPVKERLDTDPPPRRFYLFLDECGTHPLTPQDDPFSMFCLNGIVVDLERFAAFDRIWKTWKAKWLGSAHELVHEPDVRKRRRTFYHESPAQTQAIQDALAAQLAELDFWCIAAVIDKREFSKRFGTGQVDDFLPRSGYLMCLDFVLERFVQFLHVVGDDANGLVVAESRGLREDAEVHAEFFRLQLEGTQWQPEQCFRGPLKPSIDFKRKDRNDSGLQIADLAARPIAEKARDPSSTPDRWQVISGKIYDGGKGRRSSYGMKIFPTPESEEIFGEITVKANEDTEVSPLADQQLLVQ